MAVMLLRRYRHRLLWRVRRKLFVSYLLLGFVPVTLVAAFMLFSSVVLYTYVSAYVFHQGMQAIEDAAHRSAEIVAQEIGETPQAASLAVNREYGRRVFQFPDISLAVVPGVRGTPLVAAGSWRYAPAPTAIPPWITVARDYRGLVVGKGAGPGATDLLIVRAAVPALNGRAYVVVDLPVDQKVMADIRARTGMQMGAITVGPARATPAGDDRPAAPAGTAFRSTVAFVPFEDWVSRTPWLALIHLDAP